MLFLSLIIYLLIVIFQIPVGRWGYRTYGMGAGIGINLFLYCFHIMCYFLFAFASVTFIVQIAINKRKKGDDKISREEIKLKKAAVWFMLSCVIFHQLFGIWV